MERYEYITLKLIEKVLNSKYSVLKDRMKKLVFDDLLMFLARQGEGRAKKNYQYKLKDVIKAFLNPPLLSNKEKELRWRLASNPLFKVAVERFVQDSLIEWFVKNNITYETYLSPNSSDFSIFLENNELKKICSLLEISLTLPTENNIEGIILNVDSKSIMGLKNGGDAIVRSELGKFEAKWNQMSYEPPILRGAKTSSPDILMTQKYSVLKKQHKINGKNYFCVTSFVVGLFYLNDTTLFFSDSLNNLNGSYFNLIMFVVNIPNGVFQSSFYDSFFHNGKGGYDEVLIDYPKDCRFGIKNSSNQYLTFNTIIKGPGQFEKRYAYISYTPGTYKMATLNGSSITYKEFKIK